MAKGVIDTPTKKLKEAEGRYLGDLQQRSDAGGAPKNKFLTPSDLRGELLMQRELMTSLGGGKLRLITEDDLRQFQHTARQLTKRLSIGITPQLVIDNSMPAYIDRAQKQIHYAIPLRMKGGLFDFTTNAGPDSKVTRHYTQIEFMGYAAAVASDVKTSTLARSMATGPIRFQCDCEAYTYFLRYISTRLGCNLGRNEDSFPKIRNPKLEGIACKHLIRTMRALTSTTVLTKIEQQIQNGRDALHPKDKDGKPKPIKSLAPKTFKMTKEEMEEAKAHQKRQHGKAHTEIETSAQRSLRLAQQRAAKGMASSKLAGKPMAALVTPAEKKKALAAYIADQRKAVKAGIISQAVADFVISEARKNAQ